MNILEMPDGKVYGLVIKILTEHFGIDGTTRFLSICKPRECRVLWNPKKFVTKIFFFCYNVFDVNARL